MILGILNQKNMKQSRNFHPLIFLTDILVTLEGKEWGRTPRSLLKSSIPDILVYILKEGGIGPCWEFFFLLMTPEISY